ncbi:MAG: 3-deoxy-D-manno-octulosonic acid transferase [Cyclobacteriaceae bacterium]|nr:3-deoxy-D-manno-octulosonic acid transferase [Cyclobacteriaceae bacterium]
MEFLYDTGLRTLRFTYLIASWFNPKAKAFRLGRQQQASLLEKSFPLPASEKLVWIHCASLGEFEQGRPVIEALKSWNPSLKILLTFFSPSGYEVRKKYEHADFVFYLPWDSPHQGKWFANVVKPALVIFVKYEFWYYYSIELRKKNIPLISISSIFREEQAFFKKSSGKLFRKILASFDHFFVQNKQSADLLKTIGIETTTVAGDTRFDRVWQIVQQGEEVPQAVSFKNEQKLMVIGSAWPDDMEVLYPFINENTNRLKFIIATHEISAPFLDEIEKSIEGKCVRFSRAQNQSLEDAQVLLIDNVGMLSRLYRYGEFAFVGGAFRQGLHNILEAACCGIPVFFGNKAYQKFQEAVDLVNVGGAFAIGDYPALKSTYEMMTNQPDAFLLACDITRHYVQENRGATEKIMTYCKKHLS